MATELVEQPRRELRVGLVLYGGVALAIYIYGVVLEMWRLVRASRGLEQNAYREPLLAAQLRVSVDIVSGASAGGINGILLGKALATGAPLDAVRGLWLERADFAALLRSTGQRGPRSLLRTDYFESNLAAGLADMDALASGTSLETSFDLFISGTRLQGYVRRFTDDLGQILQTRQYRKSFHLRYRRGYATEAGGLIGYSRSDFGESKNPSLVAVARATSAFPFAFEPRLIELEQQTEHLFERDEPAAEYFSDGGILHNKPFTETIDTIFARPADRPVSRWLVSVEPDPEQHEIAFPPPQPEVLEVVSKALSGIPSYQSIAADLERLHEGRTRAEKTLQLLEAVEQVIATPAALAAVNAPRDAFRDFLDTQLLYPAYISIRHELAVSALADVLSDAAGLDELARERAEGGIRAFALARPQGLRDIDPSFELRRIYYLLDALERRTTGLSAEAQAAFVGSRQELWDAFEQVRQLLWRVFAGPEAIALDELEGGELENIPAAAEEALAAALPALATGLEAARLQTQAACSALDPQLSALPQPERADDAPPPPSFVQIFERFELWDMFHASAESVSGQRSRDPIAFARISPSAATATGVPAAQKLAGDTLGHFGGFFRYRWRANDLLWGRLDAAEVILRLLAAQRTPRPSSVQLGEEIQAAHLEILKAEQHPAGDAPDYRVDLLQNAIGAQTIADVPTAERARLATQSAGIVRNMLGHLGESDRLSGASRPIFRWIGILVGVALKLVGWPVRAIWARDPARAWVGTLVVLFAAAWAIVTLALVLFGVIDASWRVFILIGGALAAFVIWLVLLGLSTRIRSD
jgi:predicted acylesterase/phospholipase RssA